MKRRLHLFTTQELRWLACRSYSSDPVIRRFLAGHRVVNPAGARIKQAIKDLCVERRAPGTFRLSTKGPVAPRSKPSSRASRDNSKLASRYWPTRLGKWVTAYGVERLSNALKGTGIRVSNKAIYVWLQGKTVPRPGTVKALLQLSGGSLSIADVYAHRSMVSSEDKPSPQ